MKHVHISDDGRQARCGLYLRGINGAPNLPFCHPDSIPGWLEGEPVEGVEVCPECLTRHQQKGM